MDGLTLWTAAGVLSPVAIWLGKRFVYSPAVAGWVRAKTLVKNVNEMSAAFPTVAAAVGTLTSDVGEVKRQMTTNGGSTIRDDIAIIGGAVDQMSNHVETPIFRTDAAGAWSRCNEALVEMVGYPVEELVQMGWVNIIAESDRERVMTSLEYARRDRRKFRVPARIETRGGVKVDALLVGNPKLDGSTGRVLAWFGSIETVRAAS